MKLFSLMVLILLLALTPASAAVITGSVWVVSPAVAQNAIPANVPATPADVVFDVNSPLNFSTGNSGGTPLSTFLASGGAFNIVENTPGVLASDSNDILMQFTGFVTVTTGQNFTVTHDDGLTLIIGGLDLGFNPGPTAPVVSVATYTGPSGTFPFQLVYGECCSGPAVLQVDLPFSNTETPEPSTVMMFLGGAVLLAGSRLRR